MKKILITLLLIFIPAFSAFAVKVSSLYRAEIPVSSQSEDEKTRAVRLGLAQVLIKLSGNPSIEDVPEIRAGLEKADYYVQEFSYSSPETSSAEYLIYIHYDAADVKNLLKKAGIAYWGATRPLILVWLVVTNKGQQSEIIGNESPGVYLDEMKEQGKKFGLPLIFPMMDVADISQVTPEDVKSENLTLLKESGKRYAPTAYLIGKIEENSDGQTSEWQLILNDNTWHWTINSKSIEEIAATVINQANQALSKQYAVKTINAPKMWLKLEVTNITERHDLMQLMQYLKQLTLVQEVRLAQVSGDVVELSVLVQGSGAAFQQNASIGQRLILKSQENNKFIFEWVH